VVRLLPPHHLGPNFSASPERTVGLAFRGLYEHSLDSKDRITVPARFRSALADGVVLSKGLDPCVDVYTPEAFEQVSDTYLAPHSPFSADARKMRRRFHGGSFDEKLDSAGRVRLPKTLIEHGGLSGACVIVGAGESLEIWDAESWSRQQAELDSAAAEIAEGLAESRDR
jgi:MraZ protein